VLKGTTITGGQVEILALISRKPGVGINELAGHEGISAPSMSNAVDKLEAAGLVTRVRGIAGDRRRVDIAVTPEGARVLRSARSSRTAWLAEQLRRLTPEQTAALEAAIEPLAALVEGDAPR
jgi:DNA-binding MarR family transcriptional regulator